RLGPPRHRLRDQFVGRAVAGQPDDRLDGVGELVAGLDGDARLARLELEGSPAAVDRERVEAAVFPYPRTFSPCSYSSPSFPFHLRVTRTWSGLVSSCACSRSRSTILSRIATTGSRSRAGISTSFISLRLTMCSPPSVAEDLIAIKRSVDVNGSRDANQLIFEARLETLPWT